MFDIQKFVTLSRKNGNYSLPLQSGVSELRQTLRKKEWAMKLKICLKGN